jgi:hypothetical protein
MQQLELFELLHDRPHLGRLVARTLLDTLAGRFAGNSFFVGVDRRGLAEVNRSDHAAEVGAAEGRDADLLCVVKAGNHAQRNALEGFLVGVLFVSGLLSFLHLSVIIFFETGRL